MRTVDHWMSGQSACTTPQCYFELRSPESGDVAAQVALGSGAEIDRAVESARSVQPAWAARSPQQRGQILASIAGALRANFDYLTEIEHSETGKLIADTKADVTNAIDYFDYYGGIVRSFFGETIGLGESQLAYTRHEPYGVVGMITPWNSPILQAARGVAPALAVGNAVVVKPSEFTSSSTVALARLAGDAGLPPGLLNVVVGTGESAGAALVEHPDVGKVCFTGSVSTGRSVALAAAARLVPVTLELGGKSPNIIFADSDLDAAVESALTFTRNCGQSCSNLSRLLVEHAIHDSFVERIVELTRSITPGDRLQPLTTEAQFHKVHSYFSIATDEGATLEIGGEIAVEERYRDGWYVWPTIYTGVTAKMRIFQEEIFGPVLTVTSFEGEEEAVHLANDSTYGLIASLWTWDSARAVRMAAKIEAGQVLINGGRAGNETPFGGYKNSGLGREKGFESLRDYTQIKTVVLSAV